MYKKYIIIALSILFFISCEEDVVLNLGDIEKRLVVEASVSNVDHLAEVTLSYSQGFYEAPNLNKLKNAVVEISSADGKQNEVLSLNENNVYVSNSLTPEFGMNYNLTIDVDDQLVEVSSKLPEKVEIESVVFVPNPFYGSSDSLNPFVNVKDIKGVDNYFRLLIYEPGEELIGNYYVVDDTFGKDGTITMPIYFKTYTWGDTVIVELRHLNRATYDYYVGLSENLGGSFNSIAPGNPISNMPDDVFGYFAGYAADIDTIVLQVPTF